MTDFLPVLGLWMLGGLATGWLAGVHQVTRLR